MREPVDFPKGGIVCSLLCGSVLKCGHLCKMACRRQCMHSSSCRDIVQFTYGCGHIFQMACYKQGSLPPLCPVTIPTTLPCGHDCQLACYDQSNPVCPVIVRITLPCGHAFRLMCGKVETFKKSKCPYKYSCISRISCCNIL